MSDAIEYQINGRIYTQDFLTISQTIEVSKTLQGIKFEKLDIPTILSDLTQSGKLEQLFNIILKPKNPDNDGPLHIDEIKPSTALQVIKDFFSLNDVLEIISTIVSLMSEINQNFQLEDLKQVMNPETSTETGIS
jgi:hypothetical protein